MSVLINYAMFPTDKGDSVSSYVSRIIEMLEKKDYKYKLNSMGTNVETNTLDEALEIINISYKLLENDCNRVYVSINIDIQQEKSNRIEEKINSIQNKIDFNLA